MGDRPNCTVIIPTYNRETLLGYTLESLTRQTLPRAEFEVLVVDDGSHDDTGAVVARFQQRLNLRGFVQADEGYRAARARNVGIENATTQVCVFLDSGVLAHSQCIEAHLRSHQSSDRPAAVVGYVHGFEIDEESAAHIVAEIDVTDADRSAEALLAHGYHDVREAFYARYTDEIADLPAPWLVFWTANASARTDMLRAVGMFDETFQSWGGEDIDLGFRLHQAGARFLVNRSARATHFPHSKDFAANMASVAEHYRAMSERYRSPAVDLLTKLPPQEFFDINDILRSAEHD